jgi:hypothetical protein
MQIADVKACANLVYIERSARHFEQHIRILEAD